MSDIVVTVPKRFGYDELRGLAAWAAEGDLPGEEWSGELYEYSTWGARPGIEKGERVYVVCEDRLRGYAPLVELRFEPRLAPRRGGGTRELSHGRVVLYRGGGAVAVTIPKPIVGFRGWRYRWWDRAAEVPFPDWLGESAEKVQAWREVREGEGR